MSVTFPLYTASLTKAWSRGQPVISQDKALLITVFDLAGENPDLFDKEGAPLTNPFTLPSASAGQLAFRCQNTRVNILVEIVGGTSTLNLERSWFEFELIEIDGSYYQLLHHHLLGDMLQQPDGSWIEYDAEDPLKNQPIRWEMNSGVLVPTFRRPDGAYVQYNGLPITEPEPEPASNLLVLGGTTAIMAMYDTDFNKVGADVDTDEEFPLLFSDANNVYSLGYDVWQYDKDLTFISNLEKQTDFGFQPIWKMAQSATHKAIVVQDSNSGSVPGVIFYDNSWNKITTGSVVPVSVTANNDCVFSPDGSLVAFSHIQSNSGADRIVGSVFETATWTSVASLVVEDVNESVGFTPMVWSDDGAYLYIGQGTSPGGRITRYETATWTIDNTYALGTSSINGLLMKGNYLIRLLPFTAASMITVLDTTDSLSTTFTLLNAGATLNNSTMIFNSDKSMLLLTGSVGGLPSARLFDTSNADPTQWTLLTDTFSTSVESVINGCFV